MPVFDCRVMFSLLRIHQAGCVDENWLRDNAEKSDTALRALGQAAQRSGASDSVVSADVGEMAWVRRALAWLKLV